VSPAPCNRSIEIFRAASQLPPDQQRDYIERECAGDPVVRASVDKLLGERATTQLIAPGTARVLPDRFDWIRCLGKGGFGTVHAAFDRVQNVPVAVKVLHHSDPQVTIRFKDEFRALVGVSHPNLVALYELIIEDDICCFTMEFVPGINFLDYVAEPSGTDPAQRLFRAALQLAEAVAALHAYGKLHRDIKPSNVLVTREGRVVLLDFGLVRDLGSLAVGDTIAGTPGYMAPEQLLSGQSGKPADWYAVGVMLYQALTGRLPYPGDIARFLEMIRRDERPPQPRDLVPESSEELSGLCMQLLASAESRPTASEILTCLRQLAGVRSPQVASTALPPEVFVGREGELQALASAFDTVAADRRAAVANVSGASGMGKTALVSTFLRTLSDHRPAPLILTGRCYAGGSVPFKALDSVIDNLGRYLSRLPAGEIAAIVPAEFDAVAQAFPVLRNPVLQTGARHRPMEILDRQELRRRAFASLVELLRRISEKRPLVMSIDDLQWGDNDSVGFFRALLSAASPPAVFLIATWRSDDAGTSEFLNAYRRCVDERNPEISATDIAVRELHDGDVREIVLRLFPDDSSVTSMATRLLEQTGGCPFLIDQVARHESATPAHSALDIDTVVAERVGQLSPSARRLLELIAVAGQPLREDVARAASGAGALLLDLSALTAEHLVRARENTDLREYETYHDKVREVVLARLPEQDRQHIHRRLATAFEQTHSPDSAPLAIHYGSAGLRAEARAHALRAAENSARALAFDRAARFLRLAIDYTDGAPESAEMFDLLSKLGDALANAGRSREAADVLRRAATLAPDEHARLTLLGRAAALLLRGGHLDPGLSLLHSLASDFRVFVPRKRFIAVALFAFWRTLLAVQRLRNPDPAERKLSPSQANRLDVYWSVGTGFSMVDPLLAAPFQTRHLLLAMRNGAPGHLALASAIEASNAVLRGGHIEEAEALLRKANQLGSRLEDPYVLGVSAMMGAVCNQLTGRWKLALELARRAESLFRDKCTGTAGWELATTRVFILGALLWLGKWAEHRRLCTDFIRDARERGDLYAATELCLVGFESNGMLLADDAAEAVAVIDQALANWPARGMDLPRTYGLVLSAEILLYKGEGLAAFESVQKHWKRIDHWSSPLGRVQYVRVFALGLRGRAALGAAVELRRAGKPEWAAYVDIAEGCADRIERERTGWGQAVSAVLRSGVHATRGRREAAITALEVAESAAEYSDMNMCAAAVRIRRGQISGDDRGRRLIAEGEAFMRSQGVVNPERVTFMITPGEWQPAAKPRA
jgi:eukaryotic-like serine/threonine-protein kinase